MATEEANTKQCRKCGVTKPHAEFYVQRSLPDGRTTRCKDCLYMRKEVRVVACAECEVEFTTTDHRARLCRAIGCRRANATRKMAARRADPANTDRLTTISRRADARRVARRTPEERAEKLAYLSRYLSDPATRFRITRSAIQRLYGISASGWDRLIIAQCGRCAICEFPFGPGRTSGPNVDHDHETGIVRGLLCGKCNQGLGLFMESTEALRAAVDYLSQRRESA